MKEKYGGAGINYFTGGSGSYLKLTLTVLEHWEAACS